MIGREVDDGWMDGICDKKEDGCGHQGWARLLPKVQADLGQGHGAGLKHPVGCERWGVPCKLEGI